MTTVQEAVTEIEPLIAHFDSFYKTTAGEIIVVVAGAVIDPSYVRVVPDVAVQKTFCRTPAGSIEVVFAGHAIDPRYQLITTEVAQENTVYQTPDGGVDVVHAGQEIDPRYTLWVRPTPTAEQIAQQAAQIISRLENDVQVYIDSVAKSKGYDSASRCISYINSTNVTWKSEATSMNAWRDAVWSYCANLLQTATTPPTRDELIAELPTAPW